MIIRFSKNLKTLRGRRNCLLDKIMFEKYDKLFAFEQHVNIIAVCYNIIKCYRNTLDRKYYNYIKLVNDPKVIANKDI